MMHVTLRIFVFLTASVVLLLVLACGADPLQAPPSAGSASGASQPGNLPQDTISVVTTSNIVADWVQAIGRDRVAVFPLLPVNSDPHTFQPGARDVAQVADADLVFSVGLALEGGWLDGLVHNAAGDPGKIVPLGEAVDPINFGEIFEEHGDAEHEGAEDSHDGQEGEHEGGEDEDHGHGGLDPHFWFDPLRVKQAVDTIGAQLAAADPAGRTFYQDNAAAYNRELDGLHTWIQQEVAKLPEERRLLVTSHDTLQYFAQRYGFRVVGAIMPATTDAEPTGQALAELIETIEHAGVPAVFAEKSHSAQLSRRVSEETGAELIGGLYTGSLGAPGGEAGTYLDLMRYDVNTIVDALQ